MSAMLTTILTIIYALCAIFLGIYAASTFLMLAVYWIHRRENPPVPAVDRWPTVVLQLPVYNERYVVQRLLEAVARLDYPRELLTVQVLDDSTDDTTALIAECVAQLQQTGLNIHHVRRDNREGFKAGALSYGLSLVDAEYAAILDADFVPPVDFLKQTIPYMVADPRLGMVQGRWGHLNPWDNLLTRGQTLAVDGHFWVEQTARSRAGWLFTFNGTGGVWRIQCIHDAGGWEATTLTEDLDLSYRAQIRGWKFLYLPRLVVPGELPPQIAAYKQQQARWAKGTTQVLRRLLIPVWRAPLSLAQRIMATQHLAQYLPAPAMLTIVLLTPPLLLLHTLDDVPLQPLGLTGLGPPLMYLISQHALYHDWWRRMSAFPVLFILGTGIVGNNARAVIGGLLNIQTEFQRTPKFGQQWNISGYALRDRASWIEIALALYSLWGTVLALRLEPALAPVMAVYCLAFGTVGLWGIRDYWTMRRKRQLAAAAAPASAV
jgi:cellulose synthase/poly-beta-1,6-N-acetylglucosamine synthase-like glycosyltransferase